MKNGGFDSQRPYLPQGAAVEAFEELLRSELGEQVRVRRVSQEKEPTNEDGLVDHVIIIDRVDDKTNTKSSYVVEKAEAIADPCCAASDHLMITNVLKLSNGESVKSGKK